MSELERWETRYAAAGYLFGTRPNAFLEAEAHRIAPGSKVLAVSDGEGRNGVWLAERGHDVLAVDFSPRALEKARALARQRNVALRTEEADLAAWDWPVAAFDAVVAIFIQWAGPALRPKLFAAIAAALKPGGVLLMQGYRPEQIAYGTGGPPSAENMYTRALLEGAFANFTSLEIREHDSVIAEGTAHVGMSALIDLIAMK